MAFGVQVRRKGTPTRKMSYDLQPLKAPYLTGMKLKVVCPIVEMFSPLAKLLARNATMLDVRKVKVGHPPTFHPVEPDALNSGTLTSLRETLSVIQSLHIGPNHPHESILDFHNAYLSKSTTPIIVHIFNLCVMTKVAKNILAHISREFRVLAPFIQYNQEDILKLAKGTHNI